MTVERVIDLHLIENYLREATRVLQEISAEDIEAFVFELYKAWKRGSTIFFIGNGGSASTSIHFAADLNNTTRKLESLEIISGIPRVKAISLNENPSRLSALTNDEGWANVYIEQLKNFFRPGDVVVCISVHGGSGSDKAGAWSQNLLIALQFAKDQQGRALGFTGFDGGAMKTLCHVNVNVPVYSTPLVEGLHVVLHHLVIEELRERIAKNYDL